MNTPLVNDPCGYTHLLRWDKLRSGFSSPVKGEGWGMRVAEASPEISTLLYQCRHAEFTMTKLKVNSAN